jgi:hypothetical protein
MKEFLLRIISAVVGLVALFVGLGIAIGGCLLYLPELYGPTPLTLWKSILTGCLIVAAVISPGWLAYRMIRFAVFPFTRTKGAILLAVAVASLISFGIRTELKKRGQNQREIGYQSIVREYSQALRPGMTRKEVEDYVRTRNAHIRETCCVESGFHRHSYDDLIKIGAEDAPWFCGEHNVYVALQFADHRYSATDYCCKDDDLDTLKSVSRYDVGEGCL